MLRISVWVADGCACQNIFVYALFGGRLLLCHLLLLLLVDLEHILVLRLRKDIIMLQKLSSDLNYPVQKLVLDIFLFLPDELVIKTFVK